MIKSPTLFEAVRNFLGPIAAEYARIIDEGDPEAEVTVKVYGYEAKVTLAELKALDKAYMTEFYRREKRDENKFKRDDLIARMNGGKSA